MMKVSEALKTIKEYCKNGNCNECEIRKWCDYYVGDVFAPCNWRFFKVGKDEQIQNRVEQMKQVKIKLLEGGIMPTKGTKGAAAWDCYAREDVIVGAEPVLIGLGFALEIPEGYHAEIYPRSSTGYKTKLRQPNSCGIIDSDYRGEVKAMYESKVFAYGIDSEIRQSLTHIKAGERIAQMLIERNEEFEFVQVDELSETERGTGGFGSTGK